MIWGADHQQNYRQSSIFPTLFPSNALQNYPTPLLPLDRTGRFRGHIIHDAVDAAHLVDDAGGDMAEERGIALLSLEERIDTNSAAGEAATPRKKRSALRKARQSRSEMLATLAKGKHGGGA